MKRASPDMGHLLVVFLFPVAPCCRACITARCPHFSADTPDTSCPPPPRAGRLSGLASVGTWLLAKVFRLARAVQARCPRGRHRSTIACSSLEEMFRTALPKERQQMSGSFEATGSIERLLPMCKSLIPDTVLRVNNDGLQPTSDGLPSRSDGLQAQVLEEKDRDEPEGLRFSHESSHEKVERIQASL